STPRMAERLPPAVALILGKRRRLDPADPARRHARSVAHPPRAAGRGLKGPPRTLDPWANLAPPSRGGVIFFQAAWILLRRKPVRVQPLLVPSAGLANHGGSKKCKSGFPGNRSKRWSWLLP